jgi:hypothetical protein
MAESDGRLSYDAARRKAARQIATIEKVKPSPVNTNPRIKDGFERDDPGASRNILLHKLELMAQRSLKPRKNS